MLALGNALFPNKIGVHETEAYLNNRTGMQIANYEEEYKKLTECEDVNSAASRKNQTTQSEEEFRREIEKMTERGTVSEDERQKQNQMTAWDYWRRGKRWHSSGQYDAAIENFTIAINMQSNVPQFYNDRGYTYNSLGDYNRGLLYIKLGDCDKAICDLEKAIRFNPKSPCPYKHYGVAWKKKGNNQKAIFYLSKAIELNPQYKEAYQERAEVYRLMGDPGKARADETEAAKL